MVQCGPQKAFYDTDQKPASFLRETSSFVQEALGRKILVAGAGRAGTMPRRVCNNEPSFVCGGNSHSVIFYTDRNFPFMFAFCEKKADFASGRRVGKCVGD